ncbi:hypothetical protein [Fodinibius roseus]|uniref:hypothetical protein n=1 Tax=Fodinibius roseus TaxID=1194090 RepID=UPI0014809647|nr:hypothetical protein [Fodinibius roseus]
MAVPIFSALIFFTPFGSSQKGVKDFLAKAQESPAPFIQQVIFLITFSINEKSNENLR